MAKLKITQVRSSIGRTSKQKATIKALGLKKLNNSVEVETNPQIMGMVNSVRHLLKIEEI